MLMSDFYSIMNSEDVDFKLPIHKGESSSHGGHPFTNGQIKTITVSGRTRFSGKPIEFKLLCSASLEVPVSQRQKRDASAPVRPRIPLKIKVSNTVLLQRPSVVSDEIIRTVTAPTFGFENAQKSYKH